MISPWPSCGASLRERIVSLRFQRDELSLEISELTRRFESAEPSVTPDKAEQTAFALRVHLHEGSRKRRKHTPGLSLGR
jgi:hypothetical protein